MLRSIHNWLQDRTGLPDAVKHFMEEQIPETAGWRNTLGSVAGALILLQIVSGILMMMFYVPHPEAAYKSIAFVEDGLFAGSLIRALHYWGASFIVVALFFHMVRVFLSGAYRKPREGVWLLGVALFGIILALAFTGQLLPFNNAGYWAANVGIEIGSSAPVVGPFIKKFIMGGDVIGALTLTRFYAAHVVVLPGLLGLLLVGHLVLLRRHGVTRPDAAPGDGTISFFPNQLFKDMVAISVVFAGLFLIARIVGGPVSGPADPADTSYIPHPEWYFMSHFEILKITPGKLKLLATFVLPNLFLLTLVLLPWLDRSATNGIQARKKIVFPGIAVIAAIIALTAYGTANMEEDPDAATREPGYSAVAAGKAFYDSSNCATCHRIDGEGKQVGPDLSRVGLRLKPEYMKDWLREPESFVPDTQMPPTMANSRELDELIAYLQSLK
jgi:quinol-cytochrome oxidoreductase complex cytochrome b subunit